jgi:hypothetical protein
MPWKWVHDTFLSRLARLHAGWNDAAAYWLSTRAKPNRSARHPVCIGSLDREEGRCGNFECGRDLENRASGVNPVGVQSARLWAAMIGGAAISLN